MEILYINESYKNNNDAEDVYQSYDDFQTYYNFFIEKSLEHILEIHLNSNYDNFDSDSFKRKSHFPQNIYDVISRVLSSLEEEMYFYFSKARKRGENLEKLQKYSDSISNIRIQFNDENYLCFPQALDNIRTLFLQLVPKTILFQFIKSLIFESNFRFSPADSMFKQADVYEDTINYTALVYFIQKDLLDIDTNDLYRVKQDYLGQDIHINVMFDQQTEMIQKIKTLFYTFQTFKINKAKYNTKVERLKRIFDVYLISSYPTVYYPNITNELSDVDLYVELRKLGHKFKEDTTSDISKVDAFQNKIHIANDKKFIAKIQNIDLKVTS